MDITLYKVKTDRGLFLVNAIDDVEARSLMENMASMFIHVMPLKLKRMKLYHMSYFS